jgi:1,4-dihydroxy-2-naphthoate octaprenyltransferase
VEEVAVTTAAATAAVERSSLRAWILACRPATLGAAVAPVLVGTACAFSAGGFRLGPAVAALLGAIAIQIGTNLVNDVADFEKGADGAERLGPTRAVAAGLLSPRAVKIGAAVAFAAAMLAGIFLVAAAGPAVIAIGLASILSGIAYTGGPWPLGYHGLGDLFVFVFFGIVAVGGTTFVQTLHPTTLAFSAAVPVGALATAILVVNNLRDREGDARAGKRTLAVRLGRRAAIGEYLALLGVAYLVPIALAVTRGSLWPLLPSLTLPLAFPLARTIVTRDGRALNPALGGTARLLVAHSLLFAIGVAR